MINTQRNVKAVLTAVMLGFPAVGFGAIFSVGTGADAVDIDLADGLCLTADGECTLRAAVQQANALAGPDVIDLPADSYVLSIVGAGEDLSATGDLDITSEVTINGAGAALSIVDGAKIDRVFHVLPGAVVTMNDLTIQNGFANVNGAGGGLANVSGEVTLNDCNIYRNTASGFGGGLDNSSYGNSNDFAMAKMTVNRCNIYENTVLGNGGGLSNSNGILVVNDSVIRDNKGGFFPGVIQGGGIYNSSLQTIPGFVPARLEVNRTLITGHEVYTDGGGIYHLIGNMTISNSTISGNEARQNGGGIFNANSAGPFMSKVLISHTTITDNRAYAISSSIPSTGYGGGGFFNGNPSNKGGMVVSYLENSVIAANGNGGNCYNDTANGATIHKTGNFIAGDGCNNAGEANAAIDYTADDIGLGPLELNGGPTATHALITGSLAIDAANDGVCDVVDQRGYERPASGCDAGAYQTASAGPPLGATELLPTPTAPTGTSTDGSNRVPQSFSMPYGVEAGGILRGVLNSVDSDGDPLTYEILTPREEITKGDLGLDSLIGGGQGAIPGAFTFRANDDAVGVQLFSYRACDALSCSDPANISIAISNGAVVGDIGIELAEGVSGTPSSVSVVSEAVLQAQVADVAFNYPLGGFYFSIEDIPTDANSAQNGTVVVLQLPVDAVIEDDAVLRKLGVDGVWHTLAAGPHPTESTGTIDRVAKTITLVLRDNDKFDINVALGIIADPVGIAVPVVAAGTGGSTIIDTSSGEGTAANISPASSSEGGGSLSWYLLLALLPLWMRRRNTH